MTDPLLEKPVTPDPGSYPCTVLNLTKTTIETQDGPTELLRWEFMVESDAGQLELSALASLNYGARSKNARWVKALLGEYPETLAADDVTGAQALAVLDLDAEGFIKVVDIVAKPKGSA